MPNVYFSHGTKNEQYLLEDLIIESISIWGQEFYYIPRTLVGRDDILGEDRLSQAISFILTLSGLPTNVMSIAAFGVCLIVIGSVIFLIQAHLSAKMQTDYVAHWQRRLFQSYFHAYHLHILYLRIHQLSQSLPVVL